MSSYSDKLKDPRWQKKRLEVLERDDFACQSCFDGSSTLHVHHKVYSPGDPWDTPAEYLTTLCESCHEAETAERREHDTELVACVRRTFLNGDMNQIAEGFSRMPHVHTPEVMAGAIRWALIHEDTVQRMVDDYHAEMHRRAEKRRAEAAVP